MHSWSKLCTKRYKKTPNPAATSEEPGAKAGYCTCNLHTPPPKRWANHLSHSSSPNPGHTPSLMLYKEPAHFPSPSGSKQGNLLLVITPCCRSPAKALPEFLVWPLHQFLLIEEAKKMVGNNFTYNYSSKYP